MKYKILFDISSWYISPCDYESLIKSWLFDKFFDYGYSLLELKEPFSDKKVYCELLSTNSVVSKNHNVDYIEIIIEVKEKPKDKWEEDWKKEFGQYFEPVLSEEEIENIIRSALDRGNYNYNMSYDESDTATIDLHSIEKLE